MSDNKEYLYLSVNQAQSLHKQLTETLNAIPDIDSGAGKGVLVVVSYPKEGAGE